MNSRIQRDAISMDGAGLSRMIDIGDIFPEGGFIGVDSRFDKVINFRNADRVVSVVGSGLCAGALRIRLDVVDLAGIHCIDHKRGRVVINEAIELKYGLDQVYCSEVGQISSPIDRDTISDLRVILHKYSSGNDLSFLLPGRSSSASGSTIEQAFRNRVMDGFNHLKMGEINDAITLFNGTGYGLTPAGDDFICGLLMGMYLLDAKNELSKIMGLIYSLSIGANPLVNTMLHQAYHGRFDADWKALAHAFRSGSAALEMAVLQVLQCGETSGADKLTGFIVALSQQWKRM
ncbi:MAG: DUF2877 domain-containing protein [Candidatus Cloacimonetes bacterium]|nr:DUF2877 domain-containing protein [Candidatus Cloacimonadota bacterium]